MTAANITRTHRKEHRPVALCAKRTCCPRSLFFCNQALQRSATPLGAQAASLLILSFRAQRSAVEESLAILSLKNKRCLEHARHGRASGTKLGFPTGILRRQRRSAFSLHRIATCSDEQITPFLTQ